jgi:hypothetical protein
MCVRKKTNTANVLTIEKMNIKHTKCCYCRRTFNDEEENLKRTKDHFIPTSRTGTGSENVLECCQECNLWKADKMPDFWLNRVLYLEDKRSLYGSYTLFDYRQIIGSIKHWMKFFKGKKISAYKY